MKPINKYRSTLLFSRNIVTALLLSITSLTALADTPSGENNQDRILFGIAPFMSPLALAKRMAPLRIYLNDELERNVSIETTTNAAAFAQNTLSGRYDFVMTNPTFALMALNQGNHKLLAAQKRSLSGVMVVLENSPVTTLEQLAGKNIGAPPQIGFLGQMIKPYLLSKGLSGEKAANITNYHSHNDSISALRLKKVDAAFIASFMQTHLIEKGLKIRVIDKTEDFPGLCILSSSRVPDSLNKSLKKALLGLDKTAENKKILEKISMPPFRDINAGELDIVKTYMPKPLNE